MSSLVTVIIPCFNPPAAIFAQTLESVLRSTFQDCLILVVSDGSTDPGYLAVLADAKADHPRLQVIEHAENRGLSAARNTGVAACRTPFFLQLDADDLIEPTFIEKGLWALASHPEWHFCNSWSVGFGAKNFLWDRGFDRRLDFLAENQVTPTAIIRRSSDRAIGGHDESIRAGCEDWDYWLKMASHGYWGSTIPEYLTRYRHHATPIFWPNRDDPVQKARFHRQLRQRYPQLWRRGGFPSVPVHVERSPNAAVLPVSLVPRRSSQRQLVLVVPWFSLGGADRFNLNLVQQLIAHGWAVTVCATTDGPHPWLPAFLQHTPDCFSLPNFLAPEDYPRFLRYLLDARQPEVVVLSNSMLGYSLLPYLRAHHPQALFVDYNHMVTDWLQGGYARIGLHSQPALDLNIVSSEQVKAWMVTRGADARRVKVCYTGIDTAEWDPTNYDRAAVRQAWRIPEQVPVLLYPARLEPQKRPRVLVDILRGLRAVNPSFLCLIAGDGPQFGWLAAALARNGLRQHARLLGAVPPERMPELMAACDVLLLPSHMEGIALTIYEGMALGLVPVLSDVGGQREVVTPETGFLIPHGPQEVDAYVATLARLIEAPEVRAQMGRQARERIVTHFSAQQLAEQMAACLQAAREFQRGEPRPALSSPEAQRLAVQVVEDVRFERLQDRLLSADPLALSAPETGLLGRWRRLVFALKKRVLRPLYYWALRNGFDWVVPLANRLYRLSRGALK